MSDLKSWKERRWRRDPRCAYCRVVTVLRWSPPRGLRRDDPRRRPPANLATVEHLRDRFDPTRQQQAHGEIRRVLACLKCNQARGAAREASQSPAELRRRSAHKRAAVTA